MQLMVIWRENTDRVSMKLKRQLWPLKDWNIGKSRDELISDVLLWTPTHGRAKAGRPARTYIQQLCKDTGCCPEDLPGAMNDRRSGERGSGISVLPARHDDDDDWKRLFESRNVGKGYLKIINNAVNVYLKAENWSFGH